MIFFFFGYVEYDVDFGEEGFVGFVKVGFGVEFEDLVGGVFDGVEDVFEGVDGDFVWGGGGGVGELGFDVVVFVGGGFEDWWRV